MTMSKRSDAVRQASELARAERKLAQARRQLARTARRGGPHHVVAKEWAWAYDLAEARKEKLLALPGVIGHGLGFRVRRGERTHTACLTIFVERKLGEHAIPPGVKLPRTVSHGGRRLAVDVVELGRLHRQLAAGDVIGPVPLADRGTLGAFALDAQRGDVVALTAMHVANLAEFPAQGVADPEFQSPVPGTAFGRVRAGTMTGIDAAMLELDSPPAQAVTVLPSIGRISGWRPTAFPGDQNMAVRLFGASSGLQTGILQNPAVSIPSANLEAAILVDVDTQDGDSGCALVDPENLVLGFLVGRGSSQLNRLAVFTPASLVLSRLGCDIPSA